VRPAPFRALMDAVMRGARHRHAPWWLAALSFAESSFFPVPPDAMLVPMAVAQPRRAWRHALVATLASVAGGVAGWLIGHYAMEAVAPLVQRAGYWPAYLEARQWFERWGVWVVLLAGFSPIPYKVFTLSAGAAAMPLGPFVLASLAGRGARFYLVAGLAAWAGPRAEPWVRRNVERIGWASVALALLAWLVWRGATA